ncbi:MAG: magnesium-translocating P-type ATPase [Burkholderiales bacterium]|nr:magnesium-translocating P-type ATPase [Burkholderiales bacterium]
MKFDYIKTGRLARFFSRLTPIQPTSAALMSQVSRRMIEVAVMDSTALLHELLSSSEGLLDREAEERLDQYGPNAVVHEKHKSIARELFERFKNPLNLLLLALAAISFFMQDYTSTIIISIMVFLSVGVSFLQEHRSSNAAEKLRAMVSTTATVRRKDRREGVPPEVTEAFHVKLSPSKVENREVSIETLVPGDIVHLSAGDMIPADVRLLTSKDLFVSQSSLTGEALPVEKFSGVAGSDSKNPIELPNICFMGTNVVSGTATGVVVQTGINTYFGALTSTMAGQRTLTSFDKGVNKFTWVMISFMAVMVPTVFIINGFTKGDWMEAFLFATSVAVGLTPEMLPMIVTVNLGKGAMAMSRKKVIVKRLNSIQNFGAMDVLCTDKTGTLTQDRIILEKHLDINGNDCEEVLEYAYLNSFYQTGLKSLLDVAVLDYIELKSSLKAESDYRKIDEIPFDFVRRRMSVVVEKSSESKHILICKGAVEEIFSVCSKGEIGGETFDLGQSHYEHLLEVTRELNEDGFRVIAVAYKDVPQQQASYSVKDESNLTLLGYIAFLDPPKDSATEAIAALNRHGVSVKILTGDNDAVTRKICREVGLPVEHVVLGSEIEPMTSEELEAVAETATVFAKLSPMQKAQVIKALQRRGHVVGFMGDGINDGPALKAADVGVSVDTAVDIAKESADIILLEKSLMVLEEGVLEGRKVFGNIIKYIRMGASSNFGNMFSVLGASAFLPFLPMAPIQILTNNLLYDFSQTAIPTDHVDESYLSRPRKWDLGDITKFMIFIGPISSIFDYATYFTMLYIFDAWHNAPLFQTGWFVESLLSQTLIIHILRTGRIPFLQSWASLPLTVTTLVVSAVGVWLPFSPFATSLGMTPLPGKYWLALLAILACYLVLTQWAKSLIIRKFGLQ